MNEGARLRLLTATNDHEGIVWQLAWDWQGKRMVSVGADKIIRLWAWDGQVLRLTNKLYGAHQKTIRAVAFAPDGRRLAAASFDGTISIWRLQADAAWGCVATLEGHENEVKSVAWSPDSRFLASCGRDKTVWIWEALGDNGNDEDDEFECVAVLADHTQDVKQVQWHSREGFLASASYDESVRIWASDADEDDWFATACLVGHDSTVWSMAFDPLQGNYFVSGGDDDCLVLWRRRYGSKRLPVKYDPVQRVWNAHRRVIYSVSWYQGDVDWRDWDELGDDQEPNWPPQMILATGSGDRSIALWSSDCRKAAEDGPLGFRWELSELHAIHRTEDAHETEVNCVAWHPKEPLLASCDDVGTIKLWRMDRD